MGSPKSRDSSERGSIDTLPSGAMRVRVYSGKDPVTKRPHYLVKIIPPGPKQERRAREARTKLANEVDERRNPRTNATVGQLIEKHLDVVTLASKTMRGYRSTYKNHIKLLIGSTKVGRIDAEVLDSFYAELRRCREHCDGKPRIEHGTTEPHDCTEDGCKPHKCKPLGKSAVRQTHNLLSAAFKRAVRWGWISQNPADLAEAPPQATPDPQPPTPEDAARIVNAAWADPAWGTLVWVAMTSGARRGELSALRWRHVDLDKGTLNVRHSVDQYGAEMTVKETKSHQQRRIALDPETVAILRDHRKRCENDAANFERELSNDAFVFSLDPDGRTPLRPDTVTQRYGRLAQRLGISTTFHKLRHFSATELITAGVDPRTVGGRLGHGSGGATTLRVYSAWVSETDQRAAKNFGTRMPPRPTPVSPTERAKTDPSAPYEKIAAKIRNQILSGELRPGDLAPSQKQVMANNHIAAGTANRVFELLEAWQLVELRKGKRAIILEPSPEPERKAVEQEPTESAQAQLLDVRLFCLGDEVRAFSAECDPGDPKQMTRLLTNAARRHGGKNAQLADYEIEVRKPGSPDLISRFAVV